MQQLKLVWSRLKRPSILISLASQIVSILMLFNVKIDLSVVGGVLTAVVSILVMLGILSNPDTKTPGYGDDFAVCSSCQKETRHVVVGKNLLCEECGCVNCALSGTPSAAP